MGRKPLQEVINKLPPNVTIDGSTYQGVNQKARFIDSEYGEWWTIPASVLLGFRHPNHRKKEFTTKYAKPISYVLRKLKPEVTLDRSTYINMKVKARFIDSEYGEWWTVPTIVIKGTGRHPKYGKKQASNQLTLNPNEIISKLPDFLSLDITTYTKASKKAKFIDSEYGEFWKTPTSVINSKMPGHPKRVRKLSENKQTLPVEVIKSRLPSNITVDESTYINTHTKATFIDSEFGRFDSMPYHILYSGAQHPKRSSKYLGREAELLSFVQTLCPDAVGTYTLPDKPQGYESDIYVPNKRIGIEFDGLFWHSSKMKSKDYHMNKRLYFAQSGVSLIFVREDEWLFKKEIVKSIIRAKLHKLTEIYYSRKLKANPVSNQEAQKFLSNNHLMGEYRSAKSIGLYTKDNDLVSLISYKKHKSGVDISRFCNKINSSVVGGLSKLLKEVERRERPNFIQSWVDLRYGTGDSLLTLGFRHAKTTLGWKWFKGKQTFNRLYCRANMDSRKLTEAQHAKEMGLSRIYDAGQALFVNDLLTSSAPNAIIK